MSDYHFGIDYDMWIYPYASDEDGDLPLDIECVNIEGQLFLDARDAIEQVRRLLAENEQLRKKNETLEIRADNILCTSLRRLQVIEVENAKLRELCADMYGYARTLGYEHPLMDELGIEV